MEPLMGCQTGYKYVRLGMSFEVSVGTVDGIIDGISDGTKIGTSDGPLIGCQTECQNVQNLGYMSVQN